MSSTRMSARAPATPTEVPAWAWTVGAVGVLTLLRVATLFLAGHELYGDEAQYWSYGAEPAFGYYSKPPVIAWLIRGTSWLGEGEAFVRLASPLLHGAAAMLVFALARALYDARVGLWSAVAYATLPGVSFSALLISTDVPLLACWALALLALTKLCQGHGGGWAWVLGLAFGVGLLSKYAMGYLLLCLAIHALIDADGRRLARDRRVWGGLALGLLIWAPNLLWNLQHGGATLLHIGENANVGTEPWKPLEGLGFLGAQFGVMGPILFGTLLLRLAWLRRETADARERFLLAFALPMLAAILVQAFLGGANANWAATAYPAGTILVVAWLLRLERPAALRVSTGLHLLAATALAALVVLPGAARLPGAAPLLARVSGWQALTEAVERRVADGDVDVVLFDHRYPYAQVWYYGDIRPPRLRMWVTGDVSNHYELAYPFEGLGNGRALYVTDRGETAPVTRHFEGVSQQAPIRVPTLGGGRKVYRAVVLEGYRRP